MRNLVLLPFTLLGQASCFSISQRYSLRQTALQREATMASDENERTTPIFSSVKAVIFDIDGTLADSWKLGFDATQVVLEKNNVDLITEELYHECTRYATPDRLARHAGLVPEDGDEYKTTGDRLAKEFDDLYVGLVSIETAGFFDGIESFLNDIPSSVKLGALTNACYRYAEEVFKANCEEDLAKRFGAVRGADNVPAPKPAPDGLLLICEELGVKPEDCVYVGDSASDGMAAENAGMPSIGVLWGSHGEEKLRAAPFNVLCSTVDELKRILPCKAAVTET